MDTRMEATRLTTQDLRLRCRVLGLSWGQGISEGMENNMEATMLCSVQA